MRLRRYLSRNKDSKNREGNLLLTNEILKNLGLKSLVEIYQKYTRKKRYISRKVTKKTQKTSRRVNLMSELELEQKSHKYEQKLILNQLKELTSLIKKLEKRLAKLERKPVKKQFKP